MRGRPPRSIRTDALVPDSTLFRSGQRRGDRVRPPGPACPRVGRRRPAGAAGGGGARPARRDRQRRVRRAGRVGPEPPDRCRRARGRRRPLSQRRALGVALPGGGAPVARATSTATPCWSWPTTDRPPRWPPSTCVGLPLARLGPAPPPPPPPPQPPP